MEEQDWDDTPIAAEAQRAAQILTPHALKLPRPERPRRLAISNQKGGVGKTTTTVNLAAGLARNGLKILVVDLDPQGNASTALGVEHREGTVSSYELLGACTPEQVIQRSTANGNLFCIPATIDLAAVEIELVSKVRREYRLRDALSPEFIKEAGFDYVFVDCPPSLGLLTTNALNAVEEVLIPIQCEYYALEGVNQLLKYITMVQHQLNPQLHISAILLTMFDGRTKLAEEVGDMTPAQSAYILAAAEVAHAASHMGHVNMALSRGGRTRADAEYVKLQTAYVNFAFKGVDEFLRLADKSIPAYFEFAEERAA